MVRHRSLLLVAKVSKVQLPSMIVAVVVLLDVALIRSIDVALFAFVQMERLTIINVSMDHMFEMNARTQHVGNGTSKSKSSAQFRGAPGFRSLANFSPNNLRALGLFVDTAAIDNAPKVNNNNIGSNIVLL